MEGQLIDTHAHVYLPDFRKDFGLMERRMDDAGVSTVLLPNIDSASVPPLFDVVRSNLDRYRPMLGLHPCSVKANWQAELEQIKAAWDQSPSPPIAVGEIGIDLYWDTTFQAEQVEAFKAQILWARDLDVPVAIHVRNAFNEVFDALESVYYEGFRGVLHCFTGGKRHVRRALELNLHFGIGGVITFDQGLPHTLKRIPSDRIILETDAPYLAPEPHRRERNEPSFLHHTAQKVAEILDLSLEEVAQITSANAQQLFNLSNTDE